jgi:hypothetical protein
MAERNDEVGDPLSERNDKVADLIDRLEIFLASLGPEERAIELLPISRGELMKLIEFLTRANGKGRACPKHLSP